MFGRKVCDVIEHIIEHIINWLCLLLPFMAVHAYALWHVKQSP